MTKVAYVEDEPAIAELLKSGLDLFGIQVYPIYENANAAYESITTGTPSEITECELLIFDIRLPGGVTGLDLAERLRESGEKRPILIVSAYQAPSRAHLDKINASFMPKPFDFAGIVAKIQEMLER